MRSTCNKSLFLSFFCSCSFSSHHPCIHPDNGNILVSVMCATVWFGLVVEQAGIWLDWVDVLIGKLLSQ